MSESMFKESETLELGKSNQMNLNGLDCIHVEFQGNNMPHYAYGKAFMRVGNEGSKLSAKELEKGTETTPQITPLITPQIKLTSLENNIFNEVIKNPAITRKQIASNLGISPDTVKEYMEKLKKKGLLRRIGAARGGYWEVMEK